MPMFTEMFPILSTRDLPGLVRFYENGFGAVVGYRFPDDGDADFVSLDVGDIHIGIGRDPDSESGPERTALWFYTDDCDTSVGALAAAGATVERPPQDMPWGERVAHLRDPDGNQLHIGQHCGSS
jgi:uncharacterized glyoxalase superfamily protein PhnB